jgi:isopentenyl-diphosphate delta-isomerase
MPAHELLDLVDEHDNLLGITMDKAEVHDRELLHRDVHVFVSDGTAMFQQQRSFNKALMPGQWDISVGGHVAHRQTYIEAALRETAEEIGREYTPERLIPIGRLATTTVLANGKQHRTIGENFAVIDRDFRLKDITMQPEEVADVRLYDLAHLATDLSHPDTAKRHAAQPLELWRLGLHGIQRALRTGL